MNMKRWLCAILAALLPLCAFALAENEWNEKDVGFGEFDDGYDGTWVEVKDLGFEFCLPDGWQETDAPDGAAFAASSDGGKASLVIRCAAEGVDDLAAWSEANLKNSQADTANFYDVRLTGDNSSLNVYLIISDKKVLSFEFTRSSEDALSRPFALQIVSSACALWDDDDLPPAEDGEDFDFGEAFEDDLG